MITLENLTIRVGERTLVKRLNLHIAPHDKVVLRGPSGCGKSTLLLSIAGAIPLQEGSIRVNGKKLSTQTLSAIRSQIAFVGQEPVLGAERVRDALLLPFSFKAHHGQKPDQTTIQKQLHRLHLKSDILDKLCRHISGGEKQRIVLARALLLKKQIFLADEMTSALDPESKAAVMAELFRPEITLLSVSHDPDWIAACRRELVFEDQQLNEVRK